MQKRLDAEDKISGKEKYVCDMKFDDMLYAKTLRSNRAHAKIKNIIIPKLEEGYYIVDKNDVPYNRVKVIQFDQPFFAEDTVNYYGEPILLVLGPVLEKVAQILKNIIVEYEDLPCIYTLDEAIAKDNLLVSYNYSKGDLEKVKKDCSYSFQNTYETGSQEHFYLETQGMIGEYEEGKITIWGSMQCPYYIKNALIEAFKVSPDNIRIIQTTTGGAFGGKEDFPSLLAGQVAAAAVKSGKKVKLIYERNEDIICTTKRHPSKVHIKTYVDSENKIIGMDVDVKLDGGAYLGLSGIVLQRAIFAAIGAYNVENIKVKGEVYATNNVVSGAFRGFGAPQAIFAVEMNMDFVAKKLKVDPVKFRMLHFIKKGDLSSTSGVFREKILLPEMLQRLINVSNYEDKSKINIQNGKYHGIGISAFFHGGGFTGSGERDVIKSIVKLRKYKNSKVEILISNVEMGQGTKTTLRKIVAEALNIGIENIIYENPDTDKVPDSGPTVASRTILIVGKLLQDAAIKMKERWNEEEFTLETRYSFPEEYYWDGDKFYGDAYNTYSFGVNAVEVEIDPITYEVTIKNIWTIFDIGNAIDENIIEGQIDGGMTQGLGWAYSEVMKSKNGRLLQGSSTDYAVPTFKDFPGMYKELMQCPYKYGPSGAKSAGELTLIGAAPAFASAVGNALNCSINSIPLTPEYIMEVLQDERKD